MPLASFGGQDSEPPKYDQKAASYRDIQLLAHALSIVQFAARSDVDKKSVLYSALDGMARALDRYSYFVPPEVVAIFMQEMSDRRIGIGVHIARTSDGNIEVVSTEADSPSFKGGIKPRDVILAIDGKQIKNMTFIEAIKLIEGVSHSAGSSVKLSVLRKGISGPIEFVLVREFLQLKTVEWKVLDQCFGYVRVKEFRKNTVPDFKKAIQQMEKNCPMLNGLIIDLRNNPGGDAQASVELARMFLDSGMIASFESNFPGYNVKFKADNVSAYDRPVVILVDEGSASASELFSGALQLNKRARLVGRRTYGKNTCQTFVPISDDAGLYLTIGRFFLPDGSTVEGVGLVPDVLTDENTKEQELLGKAIQLLRR